MGDNDTQNRKKTSKRVILWGVAVVLIGGAIFGMVKLAAKSPAQPATLAQAISASDWIKGEKNAKVTLVEYSDFQCPACAAFHPYVKQIMQDSGSKIELAFRHFPLSQHANARPAAYATEAAGKQGKFWEMHDMIFEHQNDWSNQGNAADTFLQYAKTLKLDIVKYEKDLNSKEVKDKVEADYQSGIQSGIDATPTFFLNGKKLQITSYDQFRSLVSQAIGANP